MMGKKTVILAAAVLGTKAFDNGKKRIPCHDKNLMNLLKGYKIGGGGISILDAWTEAWDNANLRKSIPF